MWKNRLTFAVFVFAAAVLAACNGGSGGPYAVAVPGTAAPTSSSGAMSNVSFLVVVPAPSTGARKRNVVLPSNATSVTFTIESVNGTSYSGTPTTETLSTSNSACTSVSGQLSCDFNISAPVGTLIFTVTAYSGSTVIAEGNVSVTTTAGTTVSAPVTLSGTVTKIVVNVGSTVEGVSVSVPITVQAEDSNGNTILGTYTSPITLSDSDTSGTTSITTAGSDSPPAGELLSSSDTATLSYNGGTLSSAATIGASASGVSGSNVTSASFLPTTNYLAQSGSISLGYTSYDNYQVGVVATAEPSPGWSTYTSSPIPIATGQSFDGVTNAIAVTGSQYSSAVGSFAYLSAEATVYYAWSASNGAAALGLLGYSDPDNGFYEYALDLEVQGLVQTCASPYAQLVLFPMPSSWNVMSGSGACTTQFSDDEGDTDTYVYASNGSYSDNTSESDYYWPEGTATTTVDSAGDATYTTDNEYGQGTVSVPAPSPGASMIPVTWTFDGPDPIVPTPAPTAVPNPWAAIGLANGTIPNPLVQDTMTYEGAISALPAMCAVPAGLVPASNPPLTEADESVVIADPMDNWLPFYTQETVKHYYLNGVGEVCNENQETNDWFDGDTYYYYWFTAYNYELGGAISWYAGQDNTFDSLFSDTYTYITQTSLSAASARTRNFTKAATTAAAALTAMTYHLEHGVGLAKRLMKTRPSRYVPHAR
ncbi:MAG TPA: hypothetical protein VMA98_13910 [Candidatus Acidoferrales bacterium]|nr:hypothetical protein [Candidatus Acidoferrales bacterium]